MTMIFLSNQWFKGATKITGLDVQNLKNHCAINEKSEETKCDTTPTIIFENSCYVHTNPLCFWLSHTHTPLRLLEWEWSDAKWQHRERSFRSIFLLYYCQYSWSLWEQTPLGCEDGGAGCLQKWFLYVAIKGVGHRWLLTGVDQLIVNNMDTKKCHHLRLKQKNSRSTPKLCILLWSHLDWSPPVFLVLMQLPHTDILVHVFTTVWHIFNQTNRLQ